MQMILSQNSATFAKVWVTTTMVIPSSARRRSRRMMSQSVLSSRPLVTSSRNSTLGRLRISLARLAHFFCPPLSAPMR